MLTAKGQMCLFEALLDRLALSSSLLVYPTKYAVMLAYHSSANRGQDRAAAHLCSNP
jgi:hypothetical protein